jgi:hypothetical protein
MDEASDTGSRQFGPSSLITCVRLVASNRSRVPLTNKISEQPWYAARASSEVRTCVHPPSGTVDMTKKKISFVVGEFAFFGVQNKKKD